ncbi:fumarylacetoacetate hydrolase family protein [Sinorhizobium meliloti]|uniref:2-keto-4-pentenoate hydratase n=1 Tax=Rhizobium meliloti TaxID=382 RepID=UPI000371E0B9|nr:fumarylacetoacetate hydrolase family protein [Sinorhizobium meliloti]MDE3761443.1 fumarylacetoacetate hydrolase family protein [Sinorhizobium meliloti]
MQKESDATDKNHFALARELAAAFLSGNTVAGAEEDLTSMTRDEALAIQGLVVELLGESVVGWKVGALPDGDLISAPVVAGRLVQSPASLARATYGLGGVEAEIAFRFAKEPSPGKQGFEREDIIDAVEGICPVIEVVTSRWSTALKSPRNAMVADLLSNGALVVGDISRQWRGIALDSLEAQLSINETVVHRSRGGNPQSDLIGLLVTFANDLIRRGLSIAPGQIVTTGSYTGFLTASPGDVIAAEFNEFGPISVKFETI